METLNYTELQSMINSRKNPLRSNDYKFVNLYVGYSDIATVTCMGMTDKEDLR